MNELLLILAFALLAYVLLGRMQRRRGARLGLPLDGAVAGERPLAGG